MLRFGWTPRSARIKRTPTLETNPRVATTTPPKSEPTPCAFGSSAPLRAGVPSVELRLRGLPRGPRGERAHRGAHAGRAPGDRRRRGIRPRERVARHPHADPAHTALARASGAGSREPRHSRRCRPMWKRPRNGAQRDGTWGVSRFPGGRPNTDRDGPQDARRHDRDGALD